MGNAGDVGIRFEFEERDYFRDIIDFPFLFLFAIAVFFFLYASLIYAELVFILAFIMLVAGFSARMSLNYTTLFASKTEMSGDYSSILMYSLFVVVIIEVENFIISRFLLLSYSLSFSFLEINKIAIILVSVAEETFYNFMMNALSTAVFLIRFNKIEAVVYSQVINSVAFYMLHTLHYSPGMFPLLLSFRITMNLAYLLSKRISIPVISHLTVNIIAVFL